MRNRKWIVFLVLLLVAGAFRIGTAHWLPNDAPDDGRVYSQIARNILEQHVYSHEAEAPYDPSLIRLPGYPLFLAVIYKVFGHGNNGAVRIAQALIDTATCGLIALLAFYWEPDERRKRVAAITALALSAACPFTAIYAATILTEVPTMFLAVAMCVAATLAFQKAFTTEDTEEAKDDTSFKHSLLWWVVAGLLGGLAVLIRPDSGLFVAAIGLTLAIAGVVRIWSAPTERSGDGALDVSPSEKSRPIQSGVALRLPPHSKKHLTHLLAAGAVFSFAFAVVLVPWTIRNARVFHLFQPLAPAHGEMPGEFVPRGYGSWLRTWLDDERYIASLIWPLDTDPISVDDVPPQAFDSEDEENRVAALLDKYNHPEGSQTPSSAPQQSPPGPTPQASPTPVPQPKSALPAGKATPDSTRKNSNTNTGSSAEETGDENDQNDNSSDETDNRDESDRSKPEPRGPVEMTPEIDAGFAQLARERIARHPFRFYVWLPIARAETMWLDTHSQYWPFEGELLPFEDLDYDGHQQFWLPLFAGLTGVFTLLGLLGGWLLWRSGQFAARRWLLLTGLIIFLRLAFFSTLENPEPRYVVEFFPFLSILGGIAIARLGARASLPAQRAKHAQ